MMRMRWGEPRCIRRRIKRVMGGVPDADRCRTPVLIRCAIEEDKDVNQTSNVHAFRRGEPVCRSDWMRIGSIRLSTNSHEAGGSERKLRCSEYRDYQPKNGREGSSGAK